jgi:hypothetical protein
MEGLVYGIYVGSDASKELNEKVSVTLEEGKGILGDRYFKNAGTFSELLSESGDFQLTLIEKEEIEAFNTVTGLEYQPKDFRRNIITSGIRLNSLVDKEFYIENTIIYGVRLCEPCSHLASILGKEVMEYMVHKAGLRAHIIKGGTISKKSKIKT